MKNTGRCLCGAVIYEFDGEGYGLINCHCKDCQRLHGNYNPMLIVEKNKITFTNEGGLAWYDSSEANERGFCKICGSALFMRQKQKPNILISAGSLDKTDHLKNLGNIFTEEAGHYYVVPEEKA